MNLFKQRQPKRFTYTPKHNINEEQGSKQQLEAHWNDVKMSNKRKKSVFTSLPVLLFFLIAIFVLFYILKRYE